MALQLEGCLVAPQEIEFLCSPDKAGNEFLDALPSECLGDDVPEGLESLGCLSNLQFNSTQEETDYFCLGECEPMEVILGRIETGLDIAMRCWGPTQLGIALGGGEWVRTLGEASLIKDAVSKVRRKGLLLRFKGGTLIDPDDPTKCEPVRFGLVMPCATFSRNLSLNFGTADGNKTPMDLGASVKVLSAPKHATKNPNGQSFIFKTTHPDALAAAA